MDPLIKSEKDKYTKMWRRPEYREYSPGLEGIKDVLRHHMKVQKGDTAYDYGCGEGLVVDYLNQRGVIATGLDLVAVHPDTVEVCLWDLPRDMPVNDFGFCFDVMEHIPTEKVDDVFAGISRTVGKEAWFQIYLDEDSFGGLIGKKLHLTVKPIGWWRNKLTAHFPQVKIGQPNNTNWMWAHVRQ